MTAVIDRKDVFAAFVEAVTRQASSIVMAATYRTAASGEPYWRISTAFDRECIEGVDIQISGIVLTKGKGLHFIQSNFWR